MDRQRDCGTHSSEVDSREISDSNARVHFHRNGDTPVGQEEALATNALNH